MKKLFESISEKFKDLKAQTIALYVFLFLGGSLLMGTIVRMSIESIGSLIGGGGWIFRPHMLIEPLTWGIGNAIMIVFVAVFAINGGFRGSFGSGLLGGKGEGDRIEGSLENSRFLTDQERDKYFPTFTYETLTQSKNDGVDLHQPHDPVHRRGEHRQLDDHDRPEGRAFRSPLRLPQEAGL